MTTLDVRRQTKYDAQACVILLLCLAAYSPAANLESKALDANALGITKGVHVKSKSQSSAESRKANPAKKNSTTIATFLPIVTACLGALLAFLFSKRSAIEQHKRELTSNAYLDLLKGCSKIAMAQKLGDDEGEREGTSTLMDAKARICLYGSPSVVASLATFWRGGASLDTPDRMARFANVLVQIGNESGRRALEFADVTQLLYSMDLSEKDIALSDSVVVPEEETTDGMIETVDESLNTNERQNAMQNEWDLDSDLAARTQDFRQSVLNNYNELVRVGNPQGANTLQIACIVYMARSLSTLPPDSIQKLRDDNILSI